MSALLSASRDQVCRASAPLRIDCGGTLDLAAIGVRIPDPVTVNIAIGLRATVTLRPAKDKRVKATLLNADNRSGQMELEEPNPYSVALAALNVRGVELWIHTGAPLGSGLGGSSAAIVAAVAAAVRASGQPPRMTRAAIAALANWAEAQFQTSGMQDHLAAAFGGVNAWHWKFENDAQYERVAIGGQCSAEDLVERMALVYTGGQHASGALNDRALLRSRSRETTRKWIELADAVGQFALALQRGQWRRAEGLLRRERILHSGLTAMGLQPRTLAFGKVAETHNCAWRHVGAGGGAVWALGSPQDVLRLKEAWRTETLEYPSSQVLRCRLSHRGVLTSLRTR